MNNNKTIKRHIRRGFTLVEMIVVITIMAVIATLIVPKLLTHVGSAKQATAQSKASTINQQITIFLLEKGLSSIPNDFELELLTLNESDGGAPSGPLLKPNDILDPWGKPFDLLIPGDNDSDFSVISYGEDGELGGEGANEDVIN